MLNIDRDFIEDTQDDVVQVKRGRKKRSKTDMDSHMNKIDSLLKEVENEIDRKCRSQEKGVRCLQNIRRQLKDVQKETPYVVKPRKPRKKSDSGFTKPVEISEELRKFLGTPIGGKVSRNDITNAIDVYVHLAPDESRPNKLKWKHLNTVNRNLQDPGNGRKILPDKTLTSLLDYENYKTKVDNREIIKTIKKRDKRLGTITLVTDIQTDNSLYYPTIRKLIERHIIR